MAVTEVLVDDNDPLATAERLASECLVVSKRIVVYDGSEEDAKMEDYKVELFSAADRLDV